MSQDPRRAPYWFGIEQSVEDYVTTTEGSPTVIASIAGDDVGLLTIRLHSPYAAEVYVMAVLPETTVEASDAACFSTPRTASPATESSSSKSRP